MTIIKSLYSLYGIKKITRFWEFFDQYSDIRSSTIKMDEIRFYRKLHAQMRNHILNTKYLGLPMSHRTVLMTHRVIKQMTHCLTEQSNDHTHCNDQDKE